MNTRKLIEQATEQQLRDTLYKIETTLDQYDHAIFLGIDAPEGYVDGMQEIVNAVTTHIKEKTKPEPPPLHMINYDTLINTAKPGAAATTLRRVANKLASAIDYYENEEEATGEYDSGRHSNMVETLTMIKEELEQEPARDETGPPPTIPIREIYGLIESFDAMIDMGVIKPEAKAEGVTLAIEAINELINEHQNKGDLQP